jgi:kinesin family member 2/24
MEQIQNAKTFKFLTSQWAKNKQPLDHRKANLPTSEDVTIVARIRPLVENEVEEGVVEGVSARENSEQVVDLHQLVLGLPRGPKLRVSSSPSSQNQLHLTKYKSAEFYVDHVYGPEDNNERLFSDLVKPLADLAWNGGIGTFFAYGQTGSGKTFTVSAVEKLLANEFLSKKSKKNIHVSIVELGSTLNSAYGEKDTPMFFYILN